MNKEPIKSFDTIKYSSILLSAVGIFIMLMGLHFIFIRPIFVMFPEDVRFTQTNLADINPYVIDWIRMIFRSWGSFVLASGVYLTAISLTAFKRKEKWSWYTVAFASGINLSIFLVVNILLKSDFVYMISALLLIIIIVLVITHKYFFAEVRNI